MNEQELLGLLTGTRTRPILVCRIAHKHAQFINSQTTAVWLSRETVEKQEVKHQANKHNLYMMAPTVLNKGGVDMTKEGSK